MVDTRPGELSTVEARKLAEQIVAQLHTETDFKIEVLIKLERLAMQVDQLTAKLEASEKKMGGITQSIDDSKGTINKILGGLLLIAASGGLVAGVSKLFEFFRGPSS